MSNGITFSPRAQAQMNALYAYIADRAGALAAARFVEAILRYCIGLATFPKRGTARHDLYPGLRFTAFKRRVSIAYTVHATTQRVVIQGIFYGGQDFETDLDPGSFEEE